jgi:cell wall-associated NlpC family hydrolase
VVFSSDAESFLDNLNAISSYNSQRSQVVREYGVQLKQLKLRKSAADDQVAALTKTRQVLKDEKAKIDDRAAKAKALLGKLKEKERQRLAAQSRRANAANASHVSALPDVPANGRAGAAVRYAMAQVGDAYVWGATGPSAYDCSGLTMMAWAQAGVGLPHSSSAQQGAGRRVAESDLKPGDLVFYYSPVSHVGIYAGGGKMINAPQTGDVVKYQTVSSSAFSGARRL